MRRSPERGAAAVEVVGVVMLVLAVVATVALSAEPVGRWVGWKLECAVSTMDDVAGGDVECGPDPLVVAEGPDGLEGYVPTLLEPDDTGMVDPEHYEELCETGAGYDADEPCHPQDQGCEFGDGGSVVGEAEEFETVWTVEGRPVLWSGCRAYVPPPSCGPPLSGWDQGTDLADARGFDEWRECVLASTTGGPDDDPGTADCRDVTPASSGVAPGEERPAPVVQIGCAEYWVPEECAAQWKAYLEWSGPALQASRGAALRDCAITTLNAMERDCVVWQQTQGKNESYSFLFWKWSKSQAFVFEKMGDGTIRMHVLHGSGKGNGITIGPFGGAKGGFGGFSLGGYAVNGASSDNTYEFRNMEDAQAWVDWYVEYEKADKSVAQLDHYHNCYWNDCSGKSSKGKGPAFVPKKMWRDAMNHLEEVRGKEPPHRVIHTADARTGEVTVEGGATLGKTAGSAGAGVTAGGSFKIEVSLEERAITQEGKTVTTWSTNDSRGFAVLGMAFGLPKASSGLLGSIGGGKKYTGGLSVSALWNADGTLDHVQFRTTSGVLDEFEKSGGGLISVGKGPFEIFSAGFNHTTKKASGTEDVVENMVTAGALSPEELDELTAALKVLFPRGDDGRLDLDKPIDVSAQMDGGSEEDQQARSVVSSVAAKGGTRTLEYDVESESESESAGITAAGLQLASASWEESTTEKTLAESTLTYDDVDGVSRQVSPAPKCNMLKKDTSGGDFYRTGTSDPLTSSHPQGQGYFGDVSHTPID